MIWNYIMRCSNANAFRCFGFPNRGGWNVKNHFQTTCGLSRVSGLGSCVYSGFVRVRSVLMFLLIFVRHFTTKSLLELLSIQNTVALHVGIMSFTVAKRNVDL